MTLEALIARLLKIESLHAGATTDGERIASEEARKRILDHLAKLDEEPIEMRFTLQSRWAQRLFTATTTRPATRTTSRSDDGSCQMAVMTRGEPA